MPIVANRDCKVMTFFKHTKQQSGFLLFETLEANFKCPDLSFLEQAESINCKGCNLYIYKTYFLQGLAALFFEL